MFGVSVCLAALGIVNVVGTVLSLIAWLSAALFFTYTVVIIEKNSFCEENLKVALDMIKDFAGYREELLDDVSVYSNMAKAGVEGSVANSIVLFAQSMTKHDTAFLIRVAHEEKIWHAYMAGRPIHVEQMKIILKMIKRKIENVSDESSFIFKKRNSDIIN